MTFQFALRARPLLEWALDRAPQWKTFLGVDEGYAEGAALDIAQPPGDRDWVADQIEGGTWREARLYFEDRESAEQARAEVFEAAARLDLGPPESSVSQISTVEDQDWNAAWKAGFRGLRVGPWHVLPPWESPEVGAWPLVIEPGAGFGTGTHETTRLCLEILSECSLQGASVLDFGSGSGILALAAGLRGAQALGVEVDPLAIENAQKNTLLNPTAAGRVEFQQGFPRGRAFDVVVANILKPVLLEYAPQLVEGVKPGGLLILSGLLREDAEAIYRGFGPLLGLAGEGGFRVRFCGDWMALAVAKAHRPDSRR